MTKKLFSSALMLTAVCALKIKYSVDQLTDDKALAEFLQVSNLSVGMFNWSQEEWKDAKGLDGL